MCKTDQMKHLLTAIACCLAVAGSAQTPYNPDSDGNNLMGAEDLMSLLSLYGGEFYPQQTEPQIQVIALNDSLVVADILESTDVVFFTGACGEFYCGQYAELNLPNASTYKELTFLSNLGLPTITRLVSDAGDYRDMYGADCFLGSNFFVQKVIRSPDGVWLPFPYNPGCMYSGWNWPY